MRYALIAAYCWLREQEIIDSLVELLLQVVRPVKGRGFFARGDARLYLRGQFRRHVAAKLGLDSARMQF